ncbi:STAS domain-containing protein [Georgenia yuyongxinii]|uniref:STAS domain-containing protein n=1 Tax=Georgenia yuyongxinii TaxID=2589797 RepID=A0A552WTG2_9MICO|nr:STAS domain-containing protein [Georgenia yuyongxinii]TRW45976.1 STAS domain-containing protein [Georgenia yuyongxinii]
MARAQEAGWVSVLASETATRLVLTGELDEAVIHDLRAAVDAAARRALPTEIDARNVTFMDSSSVAALTRLAARLSTRPRLIEPPELLRFLLDVTKLDEAMDVVEQDPGFVGEPLHRKPDVTPA